MAPFSPTGPQQPVLTAPDSVNSAILRKEGADKTKAENPLNLTNLLGEAGAFVGKLESTRQLESSLQLESIHQFESTRQLKSTRQNQPESSNLSKEPIVLTDDSDSGNDFALAVKPKRKRPSQDHLTPEHSRRGLDGVQSKLEDDGKPSKRPKVGPSAYDQNVSPSRRVSAHSPANSPSPSAAFPHAHGNDANHPKSARNVRHVRPVTLKCQDGKQSRRAIPSNQPTLSGFLQRRHNAGQRNDGPLDPNRPPPTKAEHEARLRALADQQNESEQRGDDSMAMGWRRASSGNPSHKVKMPQVDVSDAALFQSFAAKQPPKPTTTLVNHFLDPNRPPPRKAGQDSRLLALTSMHKGSDDGGDDSMATGWRQTSSGNQSNIAKPTQLDNAKLAWLTVDDLENPSTLATNAAKHSRTPSSHRSRNNPVTNQAQNHGSRRVGIDTSNVSLDSPSSSDTATLTPSTPHFPVGPSKVSPPSAKSRRKKVQVPAWARDSPPVEDLPPAQSLIPAVPATEVFQENQPVRAYTVFKMEQQVQTPSLDPANRYVTVREVRMRSHTSVLRANRYAEEVMEKNDSRVKSAVRGKQWLPAERGPGEEGTFRGETVYANGHRHVFETREELVCLSDLPKSLASRNGRKYPIKSLLLDKEMVGVYRKRFDVFSVRVYPQGPQVHGSVRNISYKAELHGAYTCFRMANKAALRTFLELAKPENSRVEDNLHYQYDIRPNYIDSFQETVRDEDALVEIEWEPPVGSYKWAFDMMKVWVEQSELKGPVDIGDLVVDEDEAVVEGADEKGGASAGGEAGAGTEMGAGAEGEVSEEG